MLETQLSTDAIRNISDEELQKYLDAVTAGLFIAEFYADQLELVEGIVGHLNSMSQILEERVFQQGARQRQGEADAASLLRSQLIKRVQEDKQPCQ